MSLGGLPPVTLPTGGTICYTYTGGSTATLLAADGSASGLLVRSRRHLTYTRTGTPPATPNHDHDPQGNQPFQIFRGFYPTPKSGLSKAPARLETILNCYNAVFSNCPTARDPTYNAIGSAIVDFPI